MLQADAEATAARVTATITATTIAAAALGPRTVATVQDDTEAKAAKTGPPPRPARAAGVYRGEPVTLHPALETVGGRAEDLGFGV